MGFLKKLVGVAAPIVGGVFGGPAGAAIGGALGGAIGGSSGSKQSGTQTVTNQQQLDPRIANILFGGAGNNGILSQFQDLLNQPQGPGQQALTGISRNYLQNDAQNDINSIRGATNQLFAGQSAPAIGAPQNVNASQVAAPSQNYLNLSPAFKDFIYGDPGKNPYLTNALQSGINQSNQAFNTQLGDITNTLQRQVLPGIRGGAIASGTYGGSRQGVAEGLALSDFSKQATNAAQQLGLANISATTGAQAQAFDRGQDRALNALQGLSGQQYGVASQNAQLSQNAALANQDADLRARMFNQQSQLATNQQNNAGRIAAAGQLSGLFGQMAGANAAGENANITRAQQVSSLLSPFLSANSSSTSSQPIYTNPTANALGGAGTALGLYQQLAGASNGGSSANPWQFW